MPAVGFLTPYEEVETVDLGDGYYAKLKKYLTSLENGRAQNALGRPSVRTVGGEPVVEMSAMDQPAFMREVAANALVEWNLTDAKNQPLPYGSIEVNRLSIGKLPDWAVKEMVAAVKTGKRGDDDSKSLEEADASGDEGLGGSATGVDAPESEAPVLETVWPEVSD